MKLPTIGFLGAVTPAAGGELFAAFVARHPTFEAFKDQVNGLYVVSDSLIAPNLTRITGSALSARLPTIFNHSRFRQSRRFHILWKSDIHNRRV